MPRAARPKYEEGTILHVYDRGVGQMDIFRTDADRSRFLCLVVEAFRRWGTSLVAYCLMGNHFHVVAIVGEVTIERAMHWVLTRYAQYFNWRYERSGHVFQNRFKAIPCRNDRYLFELIAYTHLNPVRAGMTANPEAWPWSSHGEYAGVQAGIVDFARVEAVTGYSREELRKRYAESLGNRPEEQPLDEMVRIAAYFVGVQSDDLASGAWGRPFTRGRRLVLAWGTRAGHTLTEIAGALGCTSGALCHLRETQD